MSDDGSTITALRIRSLFARPARPGRDELLSGPIRGELLGADQLATTAAEVARRQHLTPRTSGRRGAPLLDRLTQTRTLLNDACARLTAGADRAGYGGERAEVDPSS